MRTHALRQATASERRAQDLVREQAALRRVATLVAEGAGADELFSAVTEEVAGLFDAAAVSLSRYEGDSCVVVAGCRSGFPLGSRWPLDLDSLATRALAASGPVYVDDYSEIAAQLPGARPVSPSSPAVAVPIVVDGSMWGVLALSGPGLDESLSATVERISGFAELVATAIANSDARCEVRRLLDEQSALRRVATLVAEGTSGTELFSAVAREVAQVLDLNMVTIDRYNSDASSTVVASVNDPAFPVGSRWPFDGPSVAANVRRTGRPARIDDYSELESASGAAMREQSGTSAVGVPIVVYGRVWGVICVGTTDTSPLPEGTESRLADFTRLVATAITNAESRAELAASETRAHDLAREQAAFRRVATLVAENASAEKLLPAVAEEVARVLAVPDVTIDRFDPDGTATTVVASWCTQTAWPIGSRWPLDGPSIAATIWKTGRPARIDDYKDLSGSIAAALRDRSIVRAVGVPIVVGNRIWGMIGAGPIEDDTPEAVERRLARFTELVATAIANSENRAELSASEARARELANEQAALRRVATLVAKGASPDELFSAVAEEVAGIVDIPVVGVHRYEADGTFTMVGIAGETSFTIGSRWPVRDDGIAGMILATGRPSRKDDYASMPGPAGDAARDNLALSTVGVPIVVDGSIWGFMVAAAKPGKPIPADTEERLARFTELVATAVANATTRTELLMSRARVVSAADETRRRLERDLHDGIQQRLVALALKAHKAAGLAGAGESAVKELSGLADDLVAVTDELRELARGIHPATLSEAGLDKALEALARRSAIVVDLDVSFGGRYDETVEATMYYVAAESITNAVKHARASTVTVRGGRCDEAIKLEIRDDGVGGADPRRGTGMIGLKDRVDTLGGTISFASAVGTGTIIRVKLPARPFHGEDSLPQRSHESASAP